MERCPLSYHLGTPERLGQLRATFARHGGRLTLEAFRTAIHTVAPDFASTDGTGAVSDAAMSVTDAAARSLVSPLMDPASFPAASAFPPEVEASSDRQPLGTAPVSFPVAPMSAMTPPHALPVTAGVLTSSIAAAPPPTARDRVVVLGVSPRAGPLSPMTVLSPTATPLLPQPWAGTSSPLTAPPPPPPPPAPAPIAPHALPTYRARLSSFHSNQSMMDEADSAASLRVSRLHVRDELAQGAHGDPIRRLFFQLDVDQSGAVEWDVLVEALLDETRQHDATLAEDHRSYVFSRSRGPRPINTHAGEEHANAQASVYRRQLAKDRALARAQRSTGAHARPPRPEGGEARRKAAVSEAGLYMPNADTSLIGLLDGLPSHPTLCALSSRTLALGLFDKTSLDLVKVLAASDLGGAAPELVDYLPQPDLLFTYSSNDRHLRAIVALESSTVCVFTTVPLHLEHTVRRLRTDPRRFPTTIFCGMSNGDVLLVETPAAPRTDTALAIRRVLPAIHPPQCGGVADFVLGTRGHLFTFGHDRRLRAVDIESGLVTELARPTESLRFLTLNATRHVLVAVNTAGEVRVWNPSSLTANSGTVLHLQGHGAHKAEVVGLVSVPDRPEVLTVDMSGEVRVWDLRRLACVQSGRLDGRVDDDADGDVRYGTAAAEEDNTDDSSSTAASLVAHIMKAKTVTRQYLCAVRGATFFDQTRELVGFTAERLYCMRSNCEVDARLCDWDVVLHPMYDSHTNAFVLQGPSRTTFWDSTFGHRRAVVDRAADPDVAPEAHEVTACCVDGISGHLFLATSLGEIEMHATHAMDPGTPLRRLRMADGFASDMHYCDGLRLLVAIGTTGTLLLCSDDPRNRFVSNMCLSRTPLHNLTVSEDLGLAAFADDHNRIIVQDVKTLSAATYQLALDRRTLAMSLTGAASALVTAHEARLLVVWSVPPALEVFAQLAVFDGHTQALSTAKFAYHCLYMGQMDKEPALTARRPGSSGVKARRSFGVSSGGRPATLRPHSPKGRLTDINALEANSTTTANSTLRNTQMLSSLLESTVRDWTATGTRQASTPPPAAKKKTKEKAYASKGMDDGNGGDDDDSEEATGAEASPLITVPSDDPWNAARVDFEITTLAFHESSHHLFVGYADGDVQVYALCPLLQVYQIRRSAYESRPHFSLRVPTNADIQRGRTTPQLVHTVSAAARQTSAVLSLRYVPALQLVLCSGQDRSVTVLTERGEEAGLFSMRRLPPKEWLESALDPSTESSLTAEPAASSTSAPAAFRLPHRLPLYPHGRDQGPPEDTLCCCHHRLHLKALGVTFKLQDVSFLSRSAAFCLNDSVRPGDRHNRPDASTRPRSGGHRGAGAGGGARGGRRRVPSASYAADVTARCTSLREGGPGAETPVLMPLNIPAASRLHDELLAVIGGPQTRARPPPVPATPSPPLPEGPPSRRRASPPPPAAAVLTSGAVWDSVNPPVRPERPGTAQAVAMHSFPLPPSPFASRPVTSYGTTLTITDTQQVLRLGSPSPPSPSLSPSSSGPVWTELATPQVTAVKTTARPRVPARVAALSAPRRLTPSPSRPCTGLTSRAIADNNRLNRPETAPADACQEALDRMLVEYRSELKRCLTGKAPSGRLGQMGPSQRSDRHRRDREEPVSDALMRKAAFF